MYMYVVSFITILTAIAEKQVIFGKSFDYNVDGISILVSTQ